MELQFQRQHRPVDLRVQRARPRLEPLKRFFARDPVDDRSKLLDLLAHVAAQELQHDGFLVGKFE